MTAFSSAVTVALASSTSTSACWIWAAVGLVVVVVVVVVSATLASLVPLVLLLTDLVPDDVGFLVVVERDLVVVGFLVVRRLLAVVDFLVDVGFVEVLVGDVVVPVRAGTVSVTSWSSWCR